MTKKFFIIVINIIMQCTIIAMDRPRTPRQPLSAKDTPSQKAFLLNEAINSRDVKQVRYILGKNFSPYGGSYGPAIMLFQACRGGVAENSPLSSQTNWKKWNSGSIDKEAFQAIVLWLIEDTFAKRQQARRQQEYKSGVRDIAGRTLEKRLFMTHEHIKTLE